ncbi:hypothetical protein EYR38_004682 [Pleurotus pulmonarius]|nr:hypothetical protein EYR38_004682 [Pleurotus pulmonarius]
MFSFKSAILVATALATLAAATPTASVTRRTTPASSCSTSSLMCCDSSGTAKDATIAGLLATLGIVDVGDIDALIGATCSPITVIGAGSASW